MRIYIKLTLLFLFLAFFLSCPPPEPSTYTISGYVRDYTSGKGINDSTVIIGERSTQPDSNGYFSFEYDSSEPIQTNVFVYAGPEYEFWAAYGVQIDVSENPQFNFYLVPIGPVVYSEITLSGDLPVAEADSHAELRLTITNSDGGYDVFSVYPPEDAPDYTIDVSTYGSDCFIDFVYDDDDPAEPIRGYYKHRDLSSDATLDLTGMTPDTVTVTGYSTQAFAVDLDLDGVDLSYYVSDTIDAGGTTEDVDLWNDADIPLIWKSHHDEAGPVGTYMTHKLVIGSSVPFSSAVTLPDPTLLPSFTEGVNMAQVNWDDVNTITYQEVAGTTIQLLEFEDDWGVKGQLYSKSETITLPDLFLSDVIGPGEGWDVDFIPIYATTDLDDLIDMRISAASGGGPICMTDIDIVFAVDPDHDNRAVDLID